MSSDLNYQTVFDHLNTAVVVVDSSLRLLHINHSAEMLLAISNNQALGTLLTGYFQETEGTRQALLQAVAEGSQFTKRRTQWQIHNGKKHIVDYTVTPLPDGDGIIMEISPLDRLLRISREEALISSQETARTLVRSMAHEIKNPLGGIRGAAQLLSRELANPDLDEFTQIIIEEADRLRNLVDRMLGPRQLPKPEPLNVHEVLERVAILIKTDDLEGIRLVRDYDPSIPEIQADRDQMIQSLLNIARNAVQALKEADLDEPGEIRLKTRIQRQFTIGNTHHPLVACISIIDNGPGIPENMIDEIFYPMITGRAEGTGLGLAIAQNLIQQHGGLIECESQKGYTDFSIYLPLEL
ncbi:nitrogen regulation protein NR(II) [Candidatus Pelagadaptatus aseana]|uniref:nitrogen regulation protein NR(II) n=1 Tax=Candidatus Pelagadaptatus aseana TaxID=3120508 RepID=UPI003C6F2801